MCWMRSVWNVKSFSEFMIKDQLSFQSVLWHPVKLYRLGSISESLTHRGLVKPCGANESSLHNGFCMFIATLLPQPMLTYCQLDSQEQISFSIKIQTFSVIWKYYVLSAKWWPFCRQNLCGTCIIFTQDTPNTHLVVVHTSCSASAYPDSNI